MSAKRVLFATPPHVVRTGSGSGSLPSGSLPRTSSDMESESGSILFCRCCGATERDVDEVQEGATMSWARYKDKEQGVKSGMQCKYCFRAQNNTEEWSECTISDLANRIRTQPDFASAFLAERTRIVEGHQQGRKRVKAQAKPPCAMRLVPTEHPMYHELFADHPTGHSIVNVSGVQHYLVPSSEMGTFARRFALHSGSDIVPPSFGFFL